MKGRRKQFLTYIAALLLALCAVVFATVAFSACSEGKNGEADGLNGQWSEYDSVKVGFISEEDYSDSKFDENKILPELNCLLNGKYYMLINFDIQADRDNDGRSSVLASVKVSPVKMLAATLQETNSGNFTEEISGNAKEVKVSYKIPETTKTVRNMLMVIQLTAVQRGIAEIEIGFSSDSSVQGVKTEKIEKSAVVDYTRNLKYEFNEESYAVAGFEADSAGQITEEENILFPTLYEGYYVTGIGAEAFKGCGGIKSITIPESVAEIDGTAFNGCDGLEKLEVDSRNESFISENDCILSVGGETLVLGCKNSIVPDKITAIGDGAFNGCSGLTEISITDGVKTIGSNAFAGCVNLTSVVLPPALESLGAMSFYGCTGLTEISIPVGTGTIGYEAFGECRIEKASVPLTKLTFLNRTYLKTVELLDGTSLYSTFEKYTNLESVILPESITLIGKYAFYHCSSLKSVIIPNSVTIIDSNAFYGCSALAEIEIPDSVTSIGTYAFSQCGLKSVSFGSGLAGLGNWSFYGCKYLKDVTYNGTQEQWAAITKAAHWRDDTGSYTLHCTDGDLGKSAS